MSLLDALAGGLRGAAGVLNPQIQQQTMQEDQQNSVLQNQQKMQIVQHVQQQVQSGAMPPEAGSQILVKMGAPPEIAMKIVGNMGIEAQQKIAAMEKERQFRGAITGLGPTPTQEQLTTIAGQFAGPDKLLDVQQRSLDRRDANEEKRISAREVLTQRAQEFQDKIEQRRVEHEARITEAQNNRASREQLAQMQIDAKRDMQQMMIEGRRQIGSLAASLRQQPQPQMIQNADGVFQIDRAGNARAVTTEDGKPLTGRSQEKALPTSAAKNLFENQQNLRRAEQALGLVSGQNVGGVQGDRNAVGAKGALSGTGVGDFILQRADPGGVDTRAAIADLGSMIIHDRSGAAVTAAEYPRLRPFIPKVTDDQATAQKKLERFSKEYRAISQEMRDFYRESGYKVPDVLQPSGAQPTTQPTARIQNDGDYSRLPSGATFIAPDGSTRRKP